MDKAFSKIWILIVILVAGGIFAWQYFGTPEEVGDETADWQTYRNEEYGFEFKYPYNSTGIKTDIKSLEMLLPLEESGTRLSKKAFTINIREEEYDQLLDYYCTQGMPHTSIENFNGIDFCSSVGGEDVKEGIEGDLFAHSFFTYHIIHNQKWITLSFQFFSCVPRLPDDACSVLAKFDEDKEKKTFNQMLSTFRLLETEITEEKVGPYIKVISPNRGEEWVEGKPYEIRWESKGVEKVDIVYNVAKGWLVVSGYPAESGRYLWTSEGVLEQYSSFTGEDLSKVDIKITIFERKADGTLGVQDSSDNYFSILSKDETADWQIYRNEEYGFEIKYPDDYFVQVGGERREGQLVYNLLQVDIYQYPKISYDPSNIPLVTVNVVGPNFVLGTRDWEDFSLGEIDGKISYNWGDWSVRETVSSVEIIFTSESNRMFYLIAKGDPLKDEIINKIFSTFHFLE